MRTFSASCTESTLREPIHSASARVRRQPSACSGPGWIKRSCSTHLYSQLCERNNVHAQWKEGQCRRSGRLRASTVALRPSLSVALNSIARAWFQTGSNLCFECMRLTQESSSLSHRHRLELRVELLRRLRLRSPFAASATLATTDNRGCKLINNDGLGPPPPAHKRTPTNASRSSRQASARAREAHRPPPPPLPPDLAPLEPPRFPPRSPSPTSSLSGAFALRIPPVTPGTNGLLCLHGGAGTVDPL